MKYLYTDAQIRDYRNGEKWRAVVRRGGDAHCKCDICASESGVEFHEMIHRSSTKKGTETQRLSFQKEICAVLCHDCHMRYHSLDKAQQWDNLWVRLYSLWGRDEVLAALDRLQGSMTAPLGVQLPE